MTDPVVQTEKTVEKMFVEKRSLSPIERLADRAYVLGLAGITALVCYAAAPARPEAVETRVASLEKLMDSNAKSINGFATGVTDRLTAIEKKVGIEQPAPPPPPEAPKK